MGKACGGAGCHGGRAAGKPVQAARGAAAGCAAWHVNSAPAVGRQQVIEWVSLPPPVLQIVEEDLT